MRIMNPQEPNSQTTSHRIQTRFLKSAYSSQNTALAASVSLATVAILQFAICAITALDKYRGVSESLDIAEDTPGYYDNFHNPRKWIESASLDWITDFAYVLIYIITQLGQDRVLFGRGEGGNFMLRIGSSLLHNGWSSGIIALVNHPCIWLRTMVVGAGKNHRDVKIWDGFWWTYSKIAVQINGGMAIKNFARKQIENTAGASDSRVFLARAGMMSGADWERAVAVEQQVAGDVGLIDGLTQSEKDLLTQKCLLVGLSSLISSLALSFGTTMPWGALTCPIDDAKQAGQIQWSSYRDYLPTFLKVLGWESLLYPFAASVASPFAGYTKNLIAGPEPVEEPESIV